VHGHYSCITIYSGLKNISIILFQVYYGVTTLLDAASGDGEKMNGEQEEVDLQISKS
jgi:hypothetical protein